MFCSLQIPILGMVVVKLLFLLNCYFVVEFFLCCLFDFFFPLINRKHVPCLFFSLLPHTSYSCYSLVFISTKALSRALLENSFYTWEPECKSHQCL